MILRNTMLLSHIIMFPKTTFQNLFVCALIITTLYGTLRQMYPEQSQRYRMINTVHL